MCNFIEWRADKKIVYKRYASLFFICCGDRRRERRRGWSRLGTARRRATIARRAIGGDDRTTAEGKLKFFTGKLKFLPAGVDSEDNELITLEMIHLFVEVLDRYFGNVCELDIIFNFHKAYYILDELFIAGELELEKRCPSGADGRDDGRVQEEGNGKGGRK
ncbi:hypothetical protein JL722_12791 [Aureococcus anophagefferens]|nr:hypothetical protein JL722_12791 [Aureococcus anophagefferens]